MRFFAGLKAKEIAAVLRTTEATVRRDWTIAKAWLFRYLAQHPTAQSIRALLADRKRRFVLCSAGRRGVATDLRPGEMLECLPKAIG